MNTKYTFLGVISLVVLLLAGGIVVTQQLSTPARGETHLIPTPVGGEAHATPIVRPTPIPLRDPDMPRPAQMGAIQPAAVEDIPQQRQRLAQDRYTVRRDETYTKLFVVDTSTGQEIRLGTDVGYAFLNAFTDDYVIWGYQCSRCVEDAELTTGVYAYDIANGTNITIVPGVGNADPVVDGEWVVYREQESLSAHHLGTGETIQITTELDLPLRAFANRGLAADAEQFYAIGGTAVTWIDNNIYTFDLVNHTTRQLDLPDEAIEWAYHIDTSDTVVTWGNNEGVWGYDLVTDGLFPISMVPPGWEQLKLSHWTIISVEGDNLYWILEVNDEPYGFTAPIVRNEE